MQRYPWPGNIRQLRNFCENLAVMHAGQEISEGDLDEKFIRPDEPAEGGGQKTYSKKENELKLIEEALASAGGNKTKAAQMLGISRRTLHRKIHDINQNPL